MVSRLMFQWILERRRVRRVYEGIGYVKESEEGV